MVPRVCGLLDASTFGATVRQGLAPSRDMGSVPAHAWPCFRVLIESQAQFVIIGNAGPGRGLQLRSLALTFYGKRLGVMCSRDGRYSFMPM